MTIAETFWTELYARLVEPPTFGVDLANIKRYHRTKVTRDTAPAIHVVEGLALPGADKGCSWKWKMDGRIEVYVRDDTALSAADAILAEIVRRINPEVGTVYSNDVRLTLERIEPDTEIADLDATKVDISILIAFSTQRWTLDVPGNE